MSPVRFALRYKALVIALVLALAGWGIAALLSIPRREDPEFLVRTCVVITQWPGATAEDVEQLVTHRLEESLAGLDEVKHLRSESRIGVSCLWVDLVDEGLASTEVANVWDKVQKKVNDTVARLPSGCAAPYLNRDFGDTAALVLGVYQTPLGGEAEIRKPYSPRELEKIADRLKDELRRLEAVARVDLHGVQEEVIYLEVDLERWNRLGMTAERLRELIQSRNLAVSGGMIETAHSRFGIKPAGQLQAVSQLERILTGQEPAQAPVPLADLGLKAARRYREPPSSQARYTDPGRCSVPAVVLSVTMRAGFNITGLGTAVAALLQRGEATYLPKDIRVAILSNVPRQVEAALSNFLMNLLQAIAQVIGVAYLIVGFRVALVMAAAMPVIMLGAIGLMPFFGVDLNTMSIASLVVSLGLMVDNAVEVCDNTHNFLARGHGRQEAVLLGVQQVAFPVLIATLTTAFSFLPMLSIPGNSGEYVRALPIVVTIVLFLSYLLAITFTALMAYWIMRPGHAVSPLWAAWSALRGLLARSRGAFRARPGQAARGPTPPAGGAAVSTSTSTQAGLGTGAANAWLERSCLCAIRHPLAVLLLAVLGFAGALALVATGQVGSQFFPIAARNQFVVDIELPEGSTLEQTGAVAERVERILQTLGRQPGPDDGKPRLKNLIAYRGECGPRFFLSMNPDPPSPNRAFVLVNTSSVAALSGFVADFRAACTQGLSATEQGRPVRLDPPVGARISPRQLICGPQIRHPVAVRVLGDDRERLRGYAREVAQVLRGIPGTLDVHDSWGNPAYQLAVRLDEENANLLGVTDASLAANLSALFSGQFLTSFREGEHDVPVLLRLPSEERSRLETLDRVFVEGRTGKIPLEAVASLKAQWQPGLIGRRDQRRCIEVRCQAGEGILSNAILARAEPALRELERGLPSGYRLEIGGELEQSLESEKQMSRSFHIALLLNVLCLMIIFNSFGKSLVVLITIPLAVTGSLIGLYLTDLPLGFMAMLGLMSLVGIVINNTLVLITFIEEEIKARLDSRSETGSGPPTGGLPGSQPGAPGQAARYAGLELAVFRACVVAGTRQRVVPLLLATLTTVCGILPLALSKDPLWSPMAIVVASGMVFVLFLTFLVVPALYACSVEHLGLEVFPGRSAASDPRAGSGTEKRQEPALPAEATPGPARWPAEAGPVQAGRALRQTPPRLPDLVPVARSLVRESLPVAGPERGGPSPSGMPGPQGSGLERGAGPLVLTRGPQLLTPMASILPKAAARRAGGPAEVVLLLSVDASGRLTRIAYRSAGTEPALIRSSIEAAKRARYAPARRGGRPIPGRMRVRLRFP